MFRGLATAVGIRLVRVNCCHRGDQANHGVAKLHLRINALAVRKNQPRQLARLPFCVGGSCQSLDFADCHAVGGVGALILRQQRFCQLLSGRRLHVVIQCAGKRKSGAGEPIASGAGWLSSVDGKANAALCAFVARAAGVPPSRVSVVRGLTSRDKVVRVEGTDEMALRHALLGQRTDL